MQKMRPGRAVLTGVAVFTTVGGYMIDMNRTHMYNLRWPPHARVLCCRPASGYFHYPPTTFGLFA